MEKVKLPKDVAEAIEVISRMDCYKLRLLEALIHPNAKLSREMEIVDRWVDQEDENLDILLQAIVNGYEVERTPEDKVREMFSEAVTQEVECAGKSSLWWEGRRMTIIDTLDALGIKLSGVNAE